MEVPKKKSERSRPRASIRKKVKEVDPVRNEVASVLDGLVYLTESVAKLEGDPLKKRTSRSKGRPSASRRKKVKEVDPVRKEVASVLDGLVYITESVAKLERGPRRGHRTKSANNVSRNKLNGPKNGQKNFTKEILKRRIRSRRSEDNVKGIKI